jgi:hypothetical protein
MLVRLCDEPNHERHANASIHPSEVSLYPYVNDVTCRMVRGLFVPCQAAVATESSHLLDNRHGCYLDEQTEVYEG